MSQRATQGVRNVSGRGGLADRAGALADWAIEAASEAARNAAIALGLAPSQGLQPVPVRVRTSRTSGSR